MGNTLLRVALLGVQLRLSMYQLVPVVLVHLIANLFVLITFLVVRMIVVVHVLAQRATNVGTMENVCANLA